MCGIVCLISKRPSGFWTKDMDIFRNLLVMDTLRGLDSVGALSVLKNGNAEYIKAGTIPHNLFRCKEWETFQKKSLSDGAMLVGHNRSATKGDVNSENAHPFQEGGIILVHNGTLRGDHKKYGDREVDSHAICKAFSEKDAEEVLPTIDGAFAFVWWDMKKKSLFAIRNSERPLTLTMTEDLIAIASESWMPQSQFMRDRIKCTNSFEIPEDTLYEFKVGGSYTSKRLTLREDAYEQYRPAHNHRPNVTPINQRTTVEDINKRFAAASESSAILIPRNEPPPSHGSVCTVENRPLKSLSSPFVHAEFKRGEWIGVTVTHAEEIKPSGSVRIRGKVAHPNKPPLDVVGYLSPNAKKTNLTEWLNTSVIAQICGHSNTTCGESLWIDEIQMDEEVQLWNHRMLGVAVWEEIVKGVNCCECNRHVDYEEHNVTTVQHKPDGTFKVFCADCIEPKLQGETKNGFVKMRNLAVQNAIRLGKELKYTPVAEANAPSTTSLQ